jgi:3-methyladenine DNA glycosylase AlkD
MHTKLSKHALIYYSQLSPESKLGDLRKLAKEIKKDHELAIELWNTTELIPRHLAILIMDKKQLTPDLVDQFTIDIQTHSYEERNQVMDWLMANQLTKDKQTLKQIESWENSPYALQRRIFWYYQARLRWMGKTDQTNTEYLLDTIEENLMEEEPEVQWAMNFTACQIGKWQEDYRSRCIEIGEKTGLYKDEIVVRFLR